MIKDLKKSGRLLYISSVDISMSNGPGVNEREFIFALGRMFGKRAHILIPRPDKNIKDVCRSKITYSWNYKKFSHFALLRNRLSQISKANSLIKSNDFDFIVMRMGHWAIDQLYIVNRHKIPYALKTLGIGVVDTIEKRKRIIRSTIGLLYKSIVNNIVKNAVAVDVCTEFYVSDFKSRLPVEKGRIIKIENATNTERFYPTDKYAARASIGLDQFKHIVGFVGGSPHKRGGMQMINSLPNLLETFPSLGIVIVGGGDEVNLLQKHAAKLGVEKNCVFTGLIPYDKVPEYINCFDVGISFDTSDRLMNIGNSSQKLRQYVACGVPVVSGPGGNEFLAKENLGKIVDGDDIKQVEAVLKNLLLLNKEQTEGQTEKQRQKAAAYAKKYLSVERALNDRVEFWSYMLQKR